MSNDLDPEREDRALDALIVLAFRPELRQDVPLPDLTGPAPELPPEYQRALEALEPGLVQRLRRRLEASQPRTSRRGPRSSETGRPRLTGSLHRGEEEGQLTDQAREEMERKVRELEGREEEPEGKEGPQP